MRFRRRREEQQAPPADATPPTWLHVTYQIDNGHGVGALSFTVKSTLLSLQVETNTAYLQKGMLWLGGPEKTVGFPADSRLINAEIRPCQPHEIPEEHR